MNLLLVLVVLVVGAIVYPRYAEHTDDACAAFGKRLEMLTRTGHLPSSPGNYNDLANAYMQAQYPQVPAAVRCTVAYWTTMLNPEVVVSAMRLLPAK